MPRVMDSGDHWVTIIVDIENEKIIHIDSMGMGHSKLFTTVMAWWLEEHGRRMEMITEPPSVVQRNTWTCGDMACNEIGRRWLPERFPVFPMGDGAEQSEVRVRLLDTILAWVKLLVRWRLSGLSHANSRPG